MREIGLTQGMVAKVDDQDWEYLSQFKWYVCKGRYTYYALRHVRKDDGKRTSLSMHRDLMSADYGSQVDHVNGDGLDNQRNNLRLATQIQNTQNQRIRSDNRTGYKGVHKCNDSKGWSAKIVVNRKHIGLGSYPTPEDAARAYDEAARKHYGEYARTNF